MGVDPLSLGIRTINSSRKTLLIPVSNKIMWNFSFSEKELVALKLPHSSLNQDFQRDLKLAIEILASARSFSPSYWGDELFFNSSLRFTQGSCKNQNQLFANLIVFMLQN